MANFNRNAKVLLLLGTLAALCVASDWSGRTYAGVGVDWRWKSNAPYACFVELRNNHDEVRSVYVKVRFYDVHDRTRYWPDGSVYGEDGHQTLNRQGASFAVSDCVKVADVEVRERR